MYHPIKVFEERVTDGVDNTLSVLSNLVDKFLENSVEDTTNSWFYDLYETDLENPSKITRCLYI